MEIKIAKGCYSALVNAARVMQSTDVAVREQSLHLILRFVVTRLATIGAVILPIFSKPNTIVRLAKRAIAVTLAVFFRLLTD
jgi:hypothetical protein